MDKQIVLAYISNYLKYDDFVILKSNINLADEAQISNFSKQLPYIGLKNPILAFSLLFLLPLAGRIYIKDYRFIAFSLIFPFCLFFSIFGIFYTKVSGGFFYYLLIISIVGVLVVWIYNLCTIIGDTKKFNFEILRKHLKLTKE